MEKLTLDRFDAFAIQEQHRIHVRESTASGNRRFLMLCAGTACVSTRSTEIRIAIEEQLRARHLDDTIQVVPTGCNGFCALGPVLTVMPDGVFYHSLTTENVGTIIEEHLVSNRLVDTLLFVPPGATTPVAHLDDIDFFKKQHLVVLKNRGLIDPERIEDYIARGGYRSLITALTSYTPQQILETITEAGLRGRGGGGFPTGLKWKLCAATTSELRYLICNADEGDPGAYMDRSIVEADPHAVIEGMLIGALAIGAQNGYVYIRAEYPLARHRLEIALEQARAHGLLGDSILGTHLNFDIQIKEGAGAFICGEETSLINSIHGFAPEPSQKPPFPVIRGLWDKPTTINNVETWATVPTIIEKGAAWFSRIGTDKSKGTKVFSLVGNIANAGLIEVRMGTTLREIIFDIGGGIPNGKSFKAVQTGGPSGGCIPAQFLDMPVDYERLTKIGSIMGSGGMIVMDEDSCMVDIARFFLSFTTEESCGKCTSCRDGSRALLDLLKKICAGKGVPGDLELMEELSMAIKDASMCGLGQTLANPVLSTLKYFRDEYRAHIEEHRCPAKRCTALITYCIDPLKCRGCGLCARNCPVTAISGERKRAHVINQELCTKCGICREKCHSVKFYAVYVK